MKLFILTSLLHFFVSPTNLQLLINVKNQGGDVVQESITANVTEDTVTLEFLRLDGVFVSQLVDFANEVEAMKVVIPAEEELGQSGAQTLCFLTHAAQADFIAPDAMAKLRQKNPGTVRQAEESRGWRQTTATAAGARVAGLLSAPAARHCAQAQDKVYLRQADLARWAPRPGLEQSSYGSLVTAFPARALDADGAAPAPCGSQPERTKDCICHMEVLLMKQILGVEAPLTRALDADGAAPAPCGSQPERTKDCICHMEVCVNWYPCGLKYCKGKPQGGLSYRCGIKTCNRCYRYHFYVQFRHNCYNYT